MMGIDRRFGVVLSNFWRLTLLAVIFTPWVGGCGRAPDYQIYQGPTMGTVYRVSARCPRDVAGAIEQELVSVNQEMSTYDADSVLSRFNRGDQDRWFPVPAEVLAVVQVARRLNEISQGAFDITVGPLVNAWGFGPDGPSAAEPTESHLAAAMARVGFDNLHVRTSPPALKKLADVYVDLSAIAKGHGVDRLANRLRSEGCSDFMVEIGGEVVVTGNNPHGQQWRIGIEVPDPHSVGNVHRVLGLEEAAVATSGDYRNYLEHAGRRYSHTIDPRTGSPVSHALASVTVVHESALWADGYATLLNVLGPEAGLAFAEAENLAVLFIVRNDANGFNERYTAAMQPFLR